MNVLIASAWDPRSGVLSIYRALARHLAPEGVRFSAFAFDGWREDTLWTFCEELIDGRETTLAETLMTGRYDLLQCVEGAYSPPYGVERWVRRARFRGPVVLLAAAGWRELTGATHATRYVAVSEASARILAEDATGPITVIPSGYDESVFVPGRAPRSARPVLLWVGRSYDPVKDVGLFLDLVELLPDVDAIVADSAAEPPDDMRERLEQLAPRVRRVSRLDPKQLADLYRLAGASGGALVNTSRAEGFNCAIVEALACECPVVAPKLPGLAHLEDGWTAALYDREAGPPAAAATLATIAEPAVRAAVVSEGRRQAELLWTSHAMADAYLRLYREAIDETRTTLVQALLDPVLRAGWRVALRVRPRVRRLIGVVSDRRSAGR